MPSTRSAPGWITWPLAVPSTDELPEWEQRFAEQGVTYSMAQEGPFGWALNFKGPDRVALELFAAKPV